MTRTEGARGKLRIGDDWNAISIIAQSQSNPLKAVAEFVENSIDAGAQRIRIVRGKEQGEHYLIVSDDGKGVPKNDAGVPDFKYVATHLCDSIKRRLKAQGITGLQGEFGIGLLSFWTLGETLYLSSSGDDGRIHQMRMQRNDPSYSVAAKRSLAPGAGSELKVKPLLPGIRQLSGERLSWYLAAELRDRILERGVAIEIVDHQARKTYPVIPRAFDGRLLHEVRAPATAFGDVYLELYVDDVRPTRRVGLHRHGTRVLESVTELPGFDTPPWNDGVFEGLIDAPFLNLTPGTRSGVIQDAAFAAFLDAMESVSASLLELIDEQHRAEEERASEQLLKSIQRAFREAMLALPSEEYDWFELRREQDDGERRRGSIDGLMLLDEHLQSTSATEEQKDSFDFPGPLQQVRIAPAASVVPVNEARNLRAVSRDRSRRVVTADLRFAWRVLEGHVEIAQADREIVTLTAPAEPELARIELQVTQADVTCTAEAIVTVTDTLLEAPKRSVSARGLPGYTYEHTPGALWRSRHDAARNLVVINSGHRDFAFAARSKALKLRYLGRLFVKELIQLNFPGASAAEALERMIELTLYVEENLR